MLSAVMLSWKPLSMLPICWLVLTRLVYPISFETSAETQELLKSLKTSLGSPSTAERRVGIVFLCVVVGWMTRPWLTRFLPIEGLSDPGDIIDSTSVQRQMHSLLGDLEPRERMVIESRFGLGDREEETLQVIGERLGLSRERVRQIEAKALERLRRGGKAEELATVLESRFAEL